MTEPTARPDAIVARLARLHPKLIDLSLGRIERLLAALDHPERRLPPVVHIAGTNGKGSVIAFLGAMLEAAGARVHAYTSPHLVRFNERIRLAGSLIDDAALIDVLEETETVNGEAPITVFEITTAAAFLAFSRVPADILLMETGLGGRLDATNVVGRPQLTAMTPVSLDHQEFLGHSLAEIAAEKAGILKPGVAVVLAEQIPEALVPIAERALALGAPTYRQGTGWTATPSGDGFAYSGAARRLELPLPGLVGRHQIDNAALAIACL
ncbi:MAG: Mur ligase family protein, partial [Alphaproteobacteria bacterium]